MSVTKRAESFLICSCISSGAHLTDREVQILVHVAADMRTSEIADLLHITGRTVESHIATMMRRAAVRTRAGLVALSYSVGILTTGMIPPAWSGTRCLTMP